MTFDRLITANAAFLTSIDRAKKMAMADDVVCLVGAMGTGKSLLAKSLHAHSARRDKPFVEIDCRSLHGEDFAQEAKKALGGTVALDHVEQLSAADQRMMLSWLDVVPGRFPSYRVVLMSTLPFKDLIHRGFFQEPLADKLMAQVPIVLPGLTQRREDIGLLIPFFINEFNIQFHKKVQCMSNVAMSYLINYEWPGNVEELRYVVKTAVALAERQILWLEDIPLKITLTNENLHVATEAQDYSLKAAEKRHIAKVLEQCRWNKSKAAALLKMSRPRLDRKIEEYLIAKQEK